MLFLYTTLCNVTTFRINTYREPASVDSKPLTRILNPLDATLTKNTEGRGSIGCPFLRRRTWWSVPQFTAGLQRTTANHQFAAAPVARKPPSHPARASTAQTPARHAPPESAETLPFAPPIIHGREVLPHSTGSS